MPEDGGGKHGLRRMGNKVEAEREGRQAPRGGNERACL